MDEYLRALQELLSKFNAVTDRAAALTKFHETAGPVAQHFINMGHGIERETSKTTIANANKERDDAKAELVKANATIDKLKVDKPDIKKLQEDHNTEVSNLKAQHKKDLDTERGKTRGGWLERDLAVIDRKLSEKKVNSELRRILTKEDTGLHARFDYDDKGRATVFQAGTKTPYTVAEGQDPLDPVVEEILKKVPARGFDEDIDEGSESSGHSGQNGGASGDKSKRKNIFDSIRSQGEERNKAASTANLVEKRQQKLRGSAPAR